MSSENFNVFVINNSSVKTIQAIMLKNRRQESRAKNQELRIKTRITQGLSVTNESIRSSMLCSFINTQQIALKSRYNTLPFR